MLVMYVDVTHFLHEAEGSRKAGVRVASAQGISECDPVNHL